MIRVVGMVCLSLAVGLATPAESVPSRAPVPLPALEEPGMADELIYVNFDQVDIRVMLKTIGDITGINFVVDDSVSGTVTVMSPSKIRLGDIYGVMESVLDVKGYAAVPAGAGGLVKIVPRADAVRRNLEVRIGADPAEIPQNDSLVTQIMPLKYAEAREVELIVKALLSTGLNVVIYPRTNSIVITDTSANIHHIAEIISNLDVPGSKEEVTVIALQYASAEVLSEQIVRIMDEGTGAPLPAARTRITPTTETGRKIMPDTRTNSLIAVANPEDTEIIEALAKKLDVERPRGADNVHVVYLENASADEAAKSLTAALANLRITGTAEASQQVQVTADEGTNSLIITASAQDYEVIAGIIEKLDIVREQVLVEMMIMEIGEDSLKEIGIDWATLDEAVAGSVRGFAATNFGPRVDFVGGDYEGLAVGGWRASGDNVGIGAILSALEKVSGVNILSTPHIMTSNHNTATILVGENKAFVNNSRITETTDFLTPTVIKTFEYRDVGITLEITPHISQAGMVKLEINSEFSKVIEDVTSVSADTPTTSQRQATTVVSMKDGSTVVIGGLIRDDKTTSVKKIPLIGDIPVVGNLFKFQRERLEKTNLLMFITPHVVTDQEDMEQITEIKRREMEPAGGVFEEEDKGGNN
jgi:general secretion pathway protein D